VSDGIITPEHIDGEFVPTARPGVASVEIEGEGLLYDEERGSWHLLSPTALVIWQCCDGSGTVEELAVDLAEAYQTDLAEVRTGTLVAVKKLGEQGLLAGVVRSADEEQHRHEHPHHQEANEREEAGPRLLPVPPST
jgi:hypothetical protein